MLIKSNCLLISVGLLTFWLFLFVDISWIVDLLNILVCWYQLDCWPFDRFCLLIKQSKGQQTNWYQQTKTFKRSTIQLISTNKNVQKVNNPTDINKQEHSKGQQSNWYQQTRMFKRSTIQLISTNKNVQKVNNPTDIYKQECSKGQQSNWYQHWIVGLLNILVCRYQLDCWPFERSCL
jgi:inhibitor of KinA sporulation pathway (predicted exonuclease)